LYVSVDVPPPSVTTDPAVPRVSPTVKTRVGRTAISSAIEQQTQGTVTWGGILPTARESLFAQQAENDAGTVASDTDRADAELEAPFLHTAVLTINPPPQSG